MNIEQVRDTLPRYISGMVSLEEALQVSQELATCPELMSDLRLALALRETLRSADQTVELPSFPDLATGTAATPLVQGMDALRSSLRITSLVIRTALRLGYN